MNSLYLKARDACIDNVRQYVQDAKKLYGELELINNGIIEKIATKVAEKIKSSLSPAR